MGFKLLALILIAVAFVWNLVILALTRRSYANPVPECVKDVYDAEAWERWRSYSAEKARLSLLNTLASFVLETVLLITDVYSAFAGLFHGIFLQYFSVTLLTTLVSAAVEAVFGYVDDMIIEQKYGFNHTTKATFIADTVKQMVISLLLQFGLTALLASLHRWLGDAMIIVFAVALFVLILMITLLFPFFSRIFNKFTPLEEGELRDKLTSMLSSHGYTVRAIQVMDASRRSSKSNAYFTGFGKTKTIVLYDTLIASSTPDEICAVFAHEMGHGLHKDTLKNQFMNILNIAVIAVAAFILVKYPVIYKDFGFSGVNYGFALLLLGDCVLSVISPLISLFTNCMLRRAEYRADAQAVAERYGDALIRALKTLARENFSHLAPSPVVVKLTYSHPPLAQRIAAIESAKAETEKS